MIKKFALMDEGFKVIGIIALPDYLDFDKPHHVPNIEIDDSQHIEIGMQYDTKTRNFIPSPTLQKDFKDETVTVTYEPFILSSSPTSDELNRTETDPPLPEGKRHLFSFFRRKK